MSYSPSVKLAAILFSAVASLAVVGCEGDGTVPDCPAYETFTDKDGVLDVAAYRAASEQAGCITPVGGWGHGGAGGTQGAGGSN